MKVELHSIDVGEFEVGPRLGQTKPITLPDNAQILGVTAGYCLRLYYVVPVSPKEDNDA